jgi:hypothetical protein
MNETNIELERAICRAITGQDTLTPEILNELLRRQKENSDKLDAAIKAHLLKHILKQFVRIVEEDEYGLVYTYNFSYLTDRLDQRTSRIFRANIAEVMTEIKNLGFNIDLDNRTFTIGETNV